MAAETPVSELIKDIKNGALILPEFQRGYVWTSGDVRSLLNSLYRGYPTGSFLILNCSMSWSSGRWRAPSRRQSPRSMSASPGDLPGANTSDLRPTGRRGSRIGSGDAWAGSCSP